MTTFNNQLFRAGDDISKLQYTSSRFSGLRQDRTSIVHKDGRVWHITIMELKSPVRTTDHDVYSYQLWFRSDGCRDILMLTIDAHAATRIVDVFCDLAARYYERLVSDAQGSQQHPVGGMVGVFRFRTFQQSSTPWGNRAEMHDAEGLARIDGLNVTLFPQYEEYKHIFSSIIDTANVVAVAVVDRGVNGVNSTVRSSEPKYEVVNGRRQVTNRRERLGAPEIGTRELRNTLAALIADRDKAVSINATPVVAAPQVTVHDYKGRRINVARRGQDDGN